MRLLIYGEQTIEVARQQRCYAMIDTDEVSAPECQLDLVPIRRNVVPQDRPVLRDDVPLQLRGIELLCFRLQSREPGVAVDQKFRMQNVIPEAGCVPDGPLMVDQYTIELLLDPAEFAIHDVDAEAALRIDPFIAWLPEVISNLGTLGSCRNSSALLQRQRMCNVNIQVDVRGFVFLIRSARSAHSHCLDGSQLFVLASNASCNIHGQHRANVAQTFFSVTDANRHSCAGSVRSTDLPITITSA